MAVEKNKVRWPQGHLLFPTLIHFVDHQKLHECHCISTDLSASLKIFYHVGGEFCFSFPAGAVSHHRRNAAESRERGTKRKSTATNGTID